MYSNTERIIVRNFSYILYVSNSKPGFKVLWDDLSESSQILVCYSTSKRESPYKCSAPEVRPFPRNPPCNIEKKNHFYTFSKIHISSSKQPILFLYGKNLGKSPYFLMQSSENQHFLVLSVFFSKRTLAPKILKKFTEEYFFTIDDHKFFQNFRSQCASQKNRMYGVFLSATRFS